MKNTRASYQTYLQSAHWQERRKLAIEEANGLCEKCEMPRWLARIAYGQDLNVHHLSYANLGHEPYEDLEALCSRCHEIETFGRSDLKEPKHAKCGICGTKHWDPYSVSCVLCQMIVSNTGRYALADYCFLENPATGRTCWEDILHGLWDAVKRRNGCAWEVLARLVILEKPAGKPAFDDEDSTDDIPF